MLFTALYSLILLLMLSSARRRVVAFTTRTSSLGVRRYSVHDRLFATQASRTSDETSATTTAPASTTSKSAKLLNLSSVTQQDLQTVIVDGWGYPKFRAAQVWNWIREQGVTDVQKMTNVPAALRQQLEQFSKPSALELALEETSKDGTIKRAYRCADGQVIESVLMPYSDGRYTACISSQAGCAQGCVFCATGQMGFSRQLTADEIFEQVARFAAELKQIDKQQAANDQKTHGRAKRLSNVVFMGMGEPLANYRNVVTAVNRLTSELGIGARKITISTVGIVPNIRKLTTDENMPQVRLAVSLHCATDEERSALLPANRRYGGVDELMDALREYIEVTGRRITLEWALIEGQNDTIETARQLGKLIKRSGLRRDMVHVNVIPLNPTGGFTGGPSGRSRVNAFVQALEQDYGITCTPRVRRGIDINAGCGQLKSELLNNKDKQIDNSSKSSDDSVGGGPTIASKPFAVINIPQSISFSDPRLGVYEDDEMGDYDVDDNDDDDVLLHNENLFASAGATTTSTKPVVFNDEFLLDHATAVDFESDDYEDPEFDQDWQKQEAARLIVLVQGSTVDATAATVPVVAANGATTKKKNRP